MFQPAQEQSLFSTLHISVYYDKNTYKLIKNTQSFNSESLWSQIGGVVGAFLGYSLLQIPHTLSNIFTGARNLVKEKQRHKRQLVNTDTNVNQPCLQNTTISSKSLQETTNHETMLFRKRPVVTEMCLDASGPTKLLKDGKMKNELCLPNKVNIKYDN